MATAVIDIDLAQQVEDVTGLDSYTGAYVLIRFHGRPVGHFWTQVRNARVPAGELSREGLAASVPALSRLWLERQLRWPPPRTRPLPSATVAICTREGPHDLARVLRAVAGVAGREHPVIVVDATSSGDATERVARAYPHFTCIRSDGGLNAARNRALAEAVTDIVAFCGENAAPEDGWLDALRGAFDSPLVGGAAGLALPLELETPAQEWLESRRPPFRGYLRREFDPLRCSTGSAGEVGDGGNMALRRDMLHKVGAFDERLDAGTPTRAGGDHEMFARLLARGYRLVYEPAAVIWQRHRRTWPELRGAIEDHATGLCAMWTGRVVERGELAVLPRVVRWFLTVQVPQLLKAAARCPDAVPRDLALAELAGSAKGPLAWFASARAHRDARPA